MKAEEIREKIREYIAKHGWDVTEDEERWRAYQRRRMAEDYGEEEWEGSSRPEDHSGL